METYRQTLYRYSTGEGPSVNVDPPEKASDVASFKMKPLVHNLINDEIVVDLKREADRLSMQHEEGMRQAKLLGYDPEMGRNLAVLKKRVDLISKLMFKHLLRYVLRTDLERMYDLYTNQRPGLDALIIKASAYNQNTSILDAYAKTTAAGSKAGRVNVGSSLYDSFGRVLNKKNARVWNKIKPKMGLGEFSLTSPAGIGLIILALFIILK